MGALGTLARRGRLAALALCLAVSAVAVALAGCQQADAAPEPKPRHLDLSTLALVTARGHRAPAVPAVPAMEPEIEQIAHREPAAAQPLPGKGGATEAVARASLRAEPGG